MAKELKANSWEAERMERNLQSQAARHTAARFRRYRNERPNKNSLLLAEAESLNNRLVALGIVFFEVVKQTATFADQHEKTAA